MLLNCLLCLSAKTCDKLHKEQNREREKGIEGRRWSLSLLYMVEGVGWCQYSRMATDLTNFKIF